MSNPKVFISYSHDSDEHREKVLALSERLREDGVETLLDQYENGSPQQGWPRWMLDQLDAADTVLVVCTETYYRRFRGREEPGKGKGVDWEGALMTQEIYHARSQTLKFVPVFLSACAEGWIPEPLRSGTHYSLTSERAYQLLCDFLCGVAGVEARPIGTVKKRDRRKGTPLSFGSEGDEAGASPAEGIETESPTSRRVFNVPFARNPYFTGRDKLLCELHERLNASGATRRTEALTGLGGIGKTQTAFEFAYRYADEYDCVWWVRAEDPATLVADYAGLAEALALESRQSKELKDRVQAVRAWFDEHDRWLLIFDNAPGTSAISEYRPRLARGHVLVTSRDVSWAAVAQANELQPLAETTAAEFLCTRTGDTDRASALALARALGALPLALEQARAYAERTGRTLAAYLDLFKSKQFEVLKRGEAVDYPATVATTWELAFQAIEASRPAAVDLLRLAAWLSPDRISRRLFSLAADVLPEPLASTVREELELDDALAELRRYSLVRLEEGVLTVHRLVQGITRNRLDLARQNLWCGAALRAVETLFNTDAVFDDAFRNELYAHLRPVVDTAPGGAAEPAAATKLLNRLARQHRQRSENALARHAFEDALAIFAAHESLDPDGLAMTHLGFADLLCEEGDFAGSVAHYEKALERVASASFDMAAVSDAYRHGVDPPRAAANFRWVQVGLRGATGGDAEEVTLDLAPELVAAFGLGEHPFEQTELGRELRCLRWRLWEAYGVTLPPIAPRSAAGPLPERTYLISVDGVPVAGTQIPLAARFVYQQRAALEASGIPWTPSASPLNGRPGAWVDDAHAAALAAAEIVSDAPTVIVAVHVQAVIDSRLAGFLTHDDVAGLLQIHLPENEAAADSCPLTPLVSVLRGLLEERVPIRELRTIVEVVRAGLAEECGLVQIVENVRRHSDLSWSLLGRSWQTQYFLVDPALEGALMGRVVIVPSPTGCGESVLALEPGFTQELLAAVREAVAALPAEAPPVAVLVRQAALRPHLRRIVELEFPHLPVIAPDEMDDWTREHVLANRVIGTIALTDREWIAP